MQCDIYGLLTLSKNDVDCQCAI